MKRIHEEVCSICRNTNGEHKPYCKHFKSEKPPCPVCTSDRGYCYPGCSNRKPFKWQWNDLCKIVNAPNCPHKFGRVLGLASEGIVNFYIIDVGNLSGPQPVLESGTFKGMKYAAIVLPETCMDIT